MDKNLIPPISVEKFAAYLDGNLDEQEMQQVSRLAENDVFLHQMLDASSEIDDTLITIEEQDLPIPSEISGMNFELPDIEDNDFFSSLGGRFGEEEGLYDQVDIGAEVPSKIELSQNNNTMKIMYKFSLFGKKDAATEVFGEPGNGTEVDPRLEIYQGYDSTCAIRSQQIILRDYGIDMSQEDLIAFAEQNGWFSEESGTPMGYVGYILESAGVGVHHQLDSTIYDLINELAQGHRVIVGVDSGELWADRNGNIGEQLKEFWEDLWQGQEGADHALIVAGVEVNPKDPTDVTVVLTDPGYGDLRIEYSLDDFMDAWEDSHCFMVATNTPAPYQYDETRGVMVPSNFAYEQFADQNSYPLSPNALYIPEGYSAYYEDGHLNSVGHDDDGNEISYEHFSEIHGKYRQALGGSAAPLGQDHFDKKGFVDALKGLFGHHPDIESGLIEPDPEPKPGPNPIDPDDPDPDDDMIDSIDDDE